MSGERELKHLEKAKLKAQKSHNLKEEASLCNQLGEVLAKQGQFQKAIEEHRQELQLSEVLNDVIGCAVANRRVGECLAEMGSYPAALEHQRKHLQLARSVANHVEEQRAWATIGRTYLFSYETNQSNESLQEAENAFRKSMAIVENKLQGKVSQHELSEMRARLYLNLGFLFDITKDPLRCDRYIRKSIYIAEQNKLYEDLYRANFNLGSIHCRNGEHTRAMRCFEAAKDCARKMKEKLMESECFSSIGQALLTLGDFVAAKRSLRKAFKLGSQHQTDHDIVRRNLKNAVSGCRLEEALSELGEEGQQDALGLCEQLGDLCCKVNSYRKAIDYYQMQLSHAEELQKPERELGVIHVSLATTFADLKEYELSLKHYQAELALRHGSPKEECKTWLNVAMVKEECGCPYTELEECYGKALQCAEQARITSLQAQVLKLLHSVQQKGGHPEAGSTLAQLQELQQSGESGEESEAEEVENSEPLEDSELELSESDDEDMEGYDKPVSGRRKINQWNRRNEKGETVLHRACIDGNLKHVQSLVEKGHPLNPRDNCGWTPLHEACNHGYLEIVRFLLHHQANVNDAGGGPHCEGITPLHDAIACGNFSVAELLVQKGASVSVRNAKGLTPLDGLREWQHLYRRDLDQETRQQCTHLERILTGSHDRGNTVRPVPELAESELFDSESSQLSHTTEAGSRALGVEDRRGRGSRVSGGDGVGCCSQRWVEEPPTTQVTTRSRLDWSDEDEDDLPLECFRPFRKRQRSARDGEGDPVTLSVSDGMAGGRGSLRPERERESHDPCAATSTYLSAMRSLGSAQSRFLCQTLAEPAPAPTPTLTPSALIPDAECLEEDWLEDDLWDGRHRKRPRERGGVVPETDPAARPAPNPTNSPRLPQPRKRPRQMRMTQIVERTVVGRTAGRSRQGGAALGNSDDLTPELWSTAPNVSVSQSPALPITQTVNTAVPPLIRVKVTVQETIFLIPVPHSSGEVHTVSWLAEQASQRYYQTCGLRPKLSLKKEGALLDPLDPITHVLQSDEEVLAVVLSWDLPPLSDRYKKACHSLGLVEDSLVLRACEVQGGGSCFRLSGVPLGTERLAPLLRSLRLHTAMRELRLAATRLAPPALETLLATLLTLPNLTLLDLSDNLISGPGLRELSEGVRRSAQPPFQSLRELNLSLNPLGEGSWQSLAVLLECCPVLTTLRLQACRLTTSSLQQHRHQLAEAMKGSLHLKTLCLSHNALGGLGVELILQSLPHRSLTHLDLSAVGGTGGDTLRVEHFVRYLSQDGCCLTHLKLSANRLTDDSLHDLSRCLLLCRSLEALDLSANPGLTTAGLDLLLGAVRVRSSGLQFLSLAGASVQEWSMAEGTAPRVGELQLCSAGLHKGEMERLAGSWRSALGGRGRALCRLHKCLLRAVPNGQS
ncbi:tonsoku-like protein [Leucoraja erinacea]|uniref:tonsoku-like protein n=1 Tax=Leucoraja erinaceus TaxID=7782 RepID=UPI002454E909|nr:tonsoku-like protein [Leucoraja erinacea]